MSVDQMGTPDTTTDAQRMAPGAPNVPQAQPQQDTSYAGEQVNPNSPAAASASTATPAQQNPPQTAHQSMMNKILTMATGGDSYYTAPDGTRQKAPQTSQTLGKTLIAATLAGLLSKDEYAATPYGPRRDFTGTAGNAAEAATNVVDKARQQPQKLSDEAQTRKMMTLQNNSQLVSLQSAQARLANEKNDFKIKSAAHVTEMMQPYTDYEEQRTGNNDPSQPKAFVDGGRGLDHEQAIALVKQKGNGFTENNIIQDGWADKWDDASGRMVPEPTYAVLNPDLKDIKLSKNVADVLARVNSQYKDIHAFVGGDLKIPVNAYVSASHDYQAVLTGQTTLDQLSKELGGKGVSQEQIEKLARESRSSGANILPALYSLSHAVAGGNTPDQRPDNLLDIIQHAPNGEKILGLLGLSPAEAGKKAEGIKNERDRLAKIAAEGGMGDKAPVPKEQVDALPKLAADSGLSPAQVELAGVKNITNAGQYNKAVEAIRTQANENSRIKLEKEKADLAAGDPEQMKRTATRMILTNDPSSLSSYYTSRQNVKASVEDALYQTALAAGVDPAGFTGNALDNKAATAKDFSGDKKGSTGREISSFNGFLGHSANAVDNSKRLATKTLGSGGSPIMNTAMDVVGKQLTNDPDWKAFTTSLLPVQTEMSNFLSGGFAVKAEDAQLMHQVLDPHETPARIVAAIRTLAETADIRLAEKGRNYLNTMGTTYPNLLSPASAQTLKRLGVNSKASQVAGRLPDGWQNNTLQPQSMASLPKDKASQIAKQYILAAGGDIEAGKRLARNHGWTE